MTRFSQNTRRSIRLGLQCIVIASLLGLQACGDDNNAEPNNPTPPETEDPTKDTTPPKISFAFIKDGQTVFNTIKTNVVATDDNGIQKVDLYIDANALTSFTTEPFETTWDTNTIPDGAHTIKAVATDKNGNTAEKSITIQVLNTLVSFTTPNNAIKQGQRAFVFLSDAVTGKNLVAAEVENGKKIDLKAAGFEGSEFYLTEVSVREDDDILMWSFANIKRGNNWILTSFRNVNKETPVGDAQLKFTGAKSGHRYQVISNYTEKWYEGTETEFSIPLSKSPSNLYVIEHDATGEATGFVEFKSIKANSTNPTLQLLLTGGMSISPAYIPADAEYLSYELYGHPDLNDFTEGYKVSDNRHNNKESNTTFDYMYFGGFPAYHSELIYEGPGFAMYEAATGIFKAEKLRNDIAFEFADNKITYSASGDFDFLTMDFEAAGTLWSYIVPKGSKRTVTALEVPQILNAWSFPGLESPEHYGIYQLKFGYNYDLLIERFIGKTDGGIQALFGKGEVYSEMAFSTRNTGGRSARTKTRIHMNTAEAPARRK